MVVVVAFVVAVGVAYLVWRAFRPETVDLRRRGPLGPDDDADFLSGLDSERRRTGGHDRGRPDSPGSDDRGDEPPAPAAS